MDNIITAGEKACARQMLARHGCTEETYEGIPVEVIQKDLDEEYPFYAFANRKMAEAIYAISTTDRGYDAPFKVEFGGKTATHCGYTDFKPGIREKIENALSSGKPFETDWLTSDKMFGSWKLDRHLKNGDLRISGSSFMDEGQDLAFDALNGTDVDESTVEAIVREYEEGGGRYETSGEITIHGSSNMETVIDAVQSLMARLQKDLDAMYNAMCRIAERHAQK